MYPKFIKMKNFSFYILAISFFILFSCNKDDENPTPGLQPTASFTLSNTLAKIGEEITFTNQSRNASAYEWNFDDGNFSTEENPVHAYDSDGTYTVELTATGEGGTHSAMMEVTIERPLLPPSGVYSGSTDEGGSIRFTISGTKVENFRGSYFLSSGGTVYELNTIIPSYGTMTETSEGFTVTNFTGKKLTGTFEDDTITGTWEHDYGTTGYTADKN